MALVKDARFIEDAWLHLGDDEPVANAARVTLSYARWLKERAALMGADVALGLRLPNTVAPEALGPDLSRFALIVLNFPRFTDGRAYSQARLLRGRLGYRGELRADGDVLRDQLLFMQRCGFDGFVLPERARGENWLAGLRDFDIFYQPAEDRRPWLMHLRAAAS
jgi:uncharacterized protein (DUF934 family)